MTRVRNAGAARLSAVILTMLTLVAPAFTSRWDPATFAKEDTLMPLLRLCRQRRRVLFHAGIPPRAAAELDDERFPGQRLYPWCDGARALAVPRRLVDEQHLYAPA
jgi:hypothetical protein